MKQKLNEKHEGFSFKELKKKPETDIAASNKNAHTLEWKWKENTLWFPRRSYKNRSLGKDYHFPTSSVVTKGWNKYNRF